MKSYARELLLLFAGAIVGIVSAYITSSFQFEANSLQRLQEQRLSSLKEASLALNGSTASLLTSIFKFQALMATPPLEGVAIRSRTTYATAVGQVASEVHKELFAYRAQIKTQELLLRAAFGDIYIALKNLDGEDYSKSEVALRKLLIFVDPSFPRRPEFGLNEISLQQQHQFNTLVSSLLAAQRENDNSLLLMAKKL